jgi:hygromycin-B 7''-O-kinase
VGVLQPPAFDSVKQFGDSLEDLAVWGPFALEICRRHGVQVVEMAVPPGDRSNPVLIIDGELFVKLHAPFSNYEDSIGLEPAALRSLETAEFPAPRLVAEGELFEDAWRWPYWITRGVPGGKLEHPWEGLTLEDRIALVRRLGALVRRLHEVQPNRELEDAWRARFPDGFAGFLEKRRSLLRDSQHPAYAKVEGIDLTGVAGEHSAVLHGDLEPGHLFLGDELSIIDFGDVKLGDPVYDFAALKTWMLAPWPGLFGEFLAGYGRQLTEDEERRLSLYQVLHEWGPMSG